MVVGNSSESNQKFKRYSWNLDVGQSKNTKTMSHQQKMAAEQSKYHAAVSHVIITRRKRKKNADRSILCWRGGWCYYICTIEKIMLILFFLFIFVVVFRLTCTEFSVRNEVIRFRCELCMMYCPCLIRDGMAFF